MGIILFTVISSFCNVTYTNYFRASTVQGPDFKLDALTALDHHVRRVNCLSHGNPALTIDIITDQYGNGTEHGRFTFYPSSVRSKPAAVMFITQFVTVKVANKPQHIALALKVGNGAFYFGLIFSKPAEAQLLLRALHEYDHIDENENFEISDAKLSDLFDGY